MNIFFEKFSLSFALALGLHLAILAMFGLSFSDDAERVKHKALPEIIQASMLDDNKIQQEADRLKLKEKSQNNKQRELEKKRKKEQALLKKAKKQRIKEQKKAKALKKKNKKLALKEKQRLEKVKKLKAKEAARLAKIKTQQVAEKKQQDELRKAKEHKQKQEKLAEQQRQQDLLNKQKADALAKEKQVIAAKARAEQDKDITKRVAYKIQNVVNNHWIRPISALKGLQCTIRVKLLPSGNVMDVHVVKGSGDGVFDRSAENAVWKADPLPVPKSRALFNKEFRTFTFIFKPEV